jgi:AcrR family transcriptional regulator
MRRKRNTETRGARRKRGAATRERILDSAEMLFAAEGLEASLRKVMTAAGVNVAAIHYHFGSKEKLLDAVVERRAVIINNARLSLLAEALAVRGRPEPERILHALLQPALSLSLEGEPGWFDYFRLLGRLETEESKVYAGIMASYYTKVHLAFLQALAKALPRLPREHLLWRYQSVIWVMRHAATSSEPAARFSTQPPKPASAAQALRHLLPGLTALFQAPAPRREPRLRRFQSGD